MNIDDANVPLREFTEMLVEKSTAVIVTRLEAMDLAHTVAAKELARRLEDLNHAHQKGVEDRGMFLTRQEHAADLRELSAWRESTSAALNEARGRASTLAKLYAFTGGLLAVVVSYMLQRFG